MKPFATKLLIVCGALLGMAVLASTAVAAPARGGHSKGSLLYVQETAGSSIERLGHGAYRLRLTGVSPRVTTFTDRPQRRAGIQGLEGFLGKWGANGFAADPPNAALVLDHAPASHDVALLTLSHPHYDRARQTLTYRATPLHGRDAALAAFARRADPVTAGALGAASLFVDDSAFYERVTISLWFTSAEVTSGTVQVLLSSSAAIAGPEGAVYMSGTVGTPPIHYPAAGNALTMNFSPGTTLSGVLLVPIEIPAPHGPIEVEVTNLTGTVTVSWPTGPGAQWQDLIPGQSTVLDELAQEDPTPEGP